MAEGKVVYPDIKSSSTRGGGQKEISDLLLSHVETRIAASEARIMQQVVEKTAKIEVDLTTQISNLTRTVIFTGIGAVVSVVGLYIAINQLVYDGQSTSFAVGALVEKQNAEVREKIDENARQISELVSAMKGLQDAITKPSPEAPEAP